MAMLVDTCILLQAFERKSANYTSIRAALKRALDLQESLIVSFQNNAEFWNVATRPLSQNGQGLSSVQAKRRLATIERVCEVRSENTNSYTTWKTLVENLKVSGVAVHDARLAALMIAGKIPEILTLNVRDFRRYESEGIVILTPDAYLQSRKNLNP